MAGPWDAVVAYWGDPLQGKPAAEIAAFYRRLGVFIESVVGAGNSASSRFLLHWLDGKGAPLTADTSVISDLPEVKAYLANEVRTVFLTKKQIHKTGRWGGIGPRLKRSPPFDKTPPQDAAGNYSMMYEGPPVGTITQMKFAEIMKRYSETKTITEQEKRYLDVFTSFHKFGIKSDVVVSARPGAGPAGAGVYRIEFVSWTS
ncbi:MAG: hypothetical protein JNL07_12220, partial [Rhodospirillales bacterium]|nr:hypothetical protein [Rhodospirillales bacterium]